MQPAAYEQLASVYEWLLDDAIITPEGQLTAFAPVLDGLPPGGRVLDCAAGTGLLAVGLALRGFAVTASDLSDPMLERARALAAERGVPLDARVCAWEDLPAERFEAPFDAVFCVGNSLAHAAGETARRTALRAMAGLLAPGGMLTVTSRNWELLRASGTHVRVNDRVIVRGGRRGLVFQAWTVPEAWSAPHQEDVRVALLGADGEVTVHGERLTLWPFRHEALDADLAAAGLEREQTTYADAAGRYLVTARRAADEPAGSAMMRPGHDRGGLP
jgi:SAM-dependent methyltransferase